MKKSIAVRVALSALVTVATVAINFVIAPATTLVSTNAALGQMANSDKSYLASIAEMNLASILAGTPAWILLLSMLLIWGSLFVKNGK